MSSLKTKPQSENLYAASREWATRRDDERFLTVADLKRAVLSRKEQSWTAARPNAQMRVIPQTDGGLLLATTDARGEDRLLNPTNWAFGQLAQTAGVPAAYLRKIDAELAAINLQYGLERLADRDNSLVLAQSNGDNRLRALTSETYGRIWDIQVVEAVERVNDDGRWKVPSASYSGVNPRRATTLYASDRDVFLFLVDPDHPVEVDGEVLFRGFYAWNSEVGSASFGLTTFLYRYVCDNRIIWGAQDVTELRIRHTGGAPERFAQEARPQLLRYAESSTAELVAQVKAARAKEIPLRKDETVSDWLKARGFTAPVAKAAVERAQEEEGQARTLWDIINGVTAYARTIPMTDERVIIERKAGSLMNLVA